VNTNAYDTNELPWAVCRVVKRGTKVLWNPAKFFSDLATARTAASRWATRYSCDFVVLRVTCCAKFVTSVVMSDVRKSRADKGKRWTGDKRRAAVARAANARDQRTTKLSEVVASLPNTTAPLEKKRDYK